MHCAALATATTSPHDATDSAASDEAQRIVTEAAHHPHMPRSPARRHSATSLGVQGEGLGRERCREWALPLVRA